VHQNVQAIRSTLGACLWPQVLRQDVTGDRTPAVNQKYLEKGQCATSLKHLGRDQLALTVELETTQAADLQEGANRASIRAVSLPAASLARTLLLSDLCPWLVCRRGQARLS
jgi:hypothetical protein